MIFNNKYYQNLEPLLPDDSIYHNQIVTFLIEDLGLSTLKKQMNI